MNSVTVDMVRSIQMPSCVCRVLHDLLSWLTLDARGCK